ncbi:hypothetical protein IFO69_08925 [Echinicola sp. CAU 1574]|uniref:Uncharacterized protein n=1 Tax=Echinicola arenosa TaxID=2774144 RepID=A0ABR9AJ54_9BACT|nr:hypothetical protein [Echinicola arenosa]MBD8488865.1 hypothetical protein [Echinicola arenosa]
MNKISWNKPYLYFLILCVLSWIVSLISGLETKSIDFQVKETYYMVNYKVILHALSLLFGVLAGIAWLVDFVVKQNKFNKL